MSDHGYSTETMLAQLPHVLAEDRRLYALATAIATTLSARIDELKLLKIYPRIDEMSEAVLDLLAHDFSVEWWDTDWPLERKRQSLKESWRIHRILGTPAAVDLAVQAAFGAGEVQEWIEYGGLPHHFRVAGLSTTMAQTGYAKFLRLLCVVKRESSVLDSVVMSTQAEHHLFDGVGMMKCRHIKIGCNAPK